MTRAELKEEVESLSLLSEGLRTEKMNYAIRKTEHHYRPFDKAWSDEQMIHQENFLKKKKLKQEDLEELYGQVSSLRSQLQFIEKSENPDPEKLESTKVELKAKEEKLNAIDKELIDYLQKTKAWKDFINEEVEFTFHQISFDDAFFDEGKQILNPNHFKPSLYDLMICD